MFRSKSSFKLAYYSWLFVLGFMTCVCVCVGFSSIMFLLHFNNDTGLSLWYLQQSLVVPLFFVPHCIIRQVFEWHCVYSWEDVLESFAERVQPECILKQNLQVHHIHAFSVKFFCIFGLDSTKH